MPRTNLVNAVDVALAAPVAAPDLTIEVDDALPLPPVPFYLVIDPFNDTQGREYMLCTLVVGTTLTVTRNLAGSDSDIHDAGDIVRITIASQHIEDIWDTVDTLAPQTFLHADLTDAAALPSAHHPRYIDSEAVGAMGAVGDTNPLNHARYSDAEALAQAQTLDHDHATPIAAHALVVAAHHSRYTDGEAVAAVGTIPPPQTFLHADLTDAASLPSAHHAKYLDSEAVAAVQAAGVFLPLATGGTVQGQITIQVGGGAILQFSDSQNSSQIRSFEHDFGSSLGVTLAGTEVFRWNHAAGVQFVNRDAQFLNADGVISGHVLALDGATRELMIISPKADRTNQVWIGLYGTEDTGTPNQIRIGTDAVQLVRFHPGGSEFAQEHATTINATNQNEFAFRNVVHSVSGPSGGISGDVWLVHT